MPNKEQQTIREYLAANGYEIKAHSVRADPEMVFQDVYPATNWKTAFFTEKGTFFFDRHHNTLTKSNGRVTKESLQGAPTKHHSGAKKMCSYRLSPHSIQILKQTSEKLMLSQADIVEAGIRYVELINNRKKVLDILE